MAVSIYRDGLSYVPNIRDELMYSSTNSSKLDFKNFKPWACRRTNTNGRGDDPLKITDQAREAIYRFIDQPGVCLRSGTDSIDFRKIEHEDLSHTLPPGFASEEWMLVNSREKLQLCIQEIKVRMGPLVWRNVVSFIYLGKGSCYFFCLVTCMKTGSETDRDCV